MTARKHPAARIDNRPSRLRSAPPVQRNPVGNCPSHLTPDQRAAWLEIVENAPPGVLSSADRLAVEQACQLIARSRTESDFPVSATTLLAKLLSQFGMTPSGRVGLQVPLTETEKAPNPFAQFD